jgi:transcription factor C subunit 6
MERRSKTRTGARKRYTVDAFEGIEELQDVRSDLDEDPNQAEDLDSADDFDNAAEPSSEIDDMSEANALGEGDDPPSDDASDAGERLLDDSMSIVEDELEDGPKGIPKTFRRRTGRSRKQTTDTNGMKTYTCAAHEQRLPGSNIHQRRKAIYGPSQEDIKPAIEARERWTLDPTLPSRRTNSKGHGGMHQSFYVDDEAIAKAAESEQATWTKYGGLNAFIEKQQLTILTHEEAKAYLPKNEESDVSCLMGPYKNQKLFKLRSGEVMPLNRAWNDETTNGIDATIPERPVNKAGFLINLGAMVHCLEWAPHQSGEHQYLVTSVLPNRSKSRKASGSTTSAAFSPQPPYKASLQIYAFQRTPDGTIDVAAGSKRTTMLCTKFGDARELKFCPMQLPNLDGKALGLLTGVWSDGAVRVLHVADATPTTGTRYLEVDKAAFESKPPDTVCTCVTWLSSTQIAAGCANGFVAIWDLPSSTESTSANPRPITYTSISSSYILSITSCAPSRPDYLVTSSMSGYIALTDLSRSGQSLGSPASTVYSHRIRVSQRGLVWSDFLQMIIHPEDNYCVQGTPLRRIFNNIFLARAKSNIASLALSPCHPMLLFGSASGEVIATNPVKRVLDNRSTSWQQIWFAHEWRRATAEEKAAVGETNGEPLESDSGQANAGYIGSVVGANGLSRITEGFNIQRNQMLREEKNSYSSHGGVNFTTIYEEKSAVSALAWNPNLEAGGWAAAGMGDGLLRVEDIAV